MKFRPYENIPEIIIFTSTGKFNRHRWISRFLYPTKFKSRGYKQFKHIYNKQNIIITQSIFHIFPIEKNKTVQMELEQNSTKASKEN